MLHLATKEPNLTGIAALVFESTIALSRTTWCHALYLGWERDRLVDVLEGGFDRLGANDAVRFWRAAS